MQIARVGLDIAKRFFQVHGVDAQGRVKFNKQLKRRQVLEYFAQQPACVIGMEACAGAHHWARELGKLGHTVKLMAAQFVSPYRKNEKNDANDAEAICEAVSRPNMRFVGIKSEEQQAVLTVHRARSLMVTSRTAQVNQMRGLLAEFGVTVPQGITRFKAQLPDILEDAGNGLPSLAREVLAGLLEQFRFFDTQVEQYDVQIRQIARHSEPAQRLMAIEGIGPIISTAMVATVGDATVFKSGRQFAAWLGLTPRQHSSGGKQCLGRITKRGDRYLRTLLVHGARALLRYVDRKDDEKSAWATRLKSRRHINVAAVALAAKNARIIWAVMARGTAYRPSVPVAAEAATVH